MTMTNLVLLGPPGAGKGTQAEKLSAEFALPHISTGDIFRAAIKEQTPLGKKAQKYLDRGELVPDKIVIEIVAERLRRPDTNDGFLLDGFPRTVPQADALADFLAAEGRQLTAVINITVPPEVLVKRLSGRRVCRQCGAVYHVETKREKQAGVCDQCGGSLYQREDDREEIVRNRLEVYFRQTEPLIRYYRKAGILMEVNGDRDIAGVYQEVVTGLRGRGQ